MLGNDVVDLRDVDARPETFAPRFDQRVFSKEEQRMIAQDSNPLARRWAHWAAKEAAYKLAKQVDSDFVFRPSQLIARYERDSDSGRATLERRGFLELPHRRKGVILQLEIRSFETPNYVHVVALPFGSDWGGADHVVERLTHKSGDSSVAVRVMAIREISRRLGVGAERIAIGRRERIPTVELDGMPTSLALSLSHHGRWVAYATRLQDSAEDRLLRMLSGARPLSQRSTASRRSAGLARLSQA